ncbi:hypothetical protein TVAG_322780 [Trichomonas vaginalis G3]|uniref:Zinc finger PHD-type domain-containing protein n=1 Tax=Trichomonas vaginalis (strain ATCC PRA-98 / G3) TaxID=412133 RepID=A2EL30_TRIV3|nr:FYVE/PHD zinc finger family [Trichomonas vaginalis G3]EAY06658.1 hypothetical protein TVAG_322780 [Trichomonas vaginalis G3]KAI5552865.1 FYVE/PHD zinc finger family [Trichomonas vaginalis G3]|eukprot:XP_001318881.1 hypothetical protein [Trichomonas vaginalis G3]
MNENDALMRLAKLCLHADPRVRDQRKIKKALDRKPSSNEFVRCPCRNNVDAYDQICCDICQCWCHCRCVGKTPDDKDSYVCPFCEGSETIQYLKSQNIDIPKLYRSIYDAQRRQKTNLFINSMYNVSNVVENTEKAQKWLKTLTSRDDLYHNMVRAAGTCMKGSASTSTTVELASERKSINELADNLSGLINELKSVQTPLVDNIVAQCVTFPKEKRVKKHFLDDTTTDTSVESDQ